MEDPSGKETSTRKPNGFVSRDTNTEPLFITLSWIDFDTNITKNRVDFVTEKNK